MTTSQILITGLIGLLTGALGSLVAPWMHWGIEKRKNRRKERLRLLTDLRNYLLKENPQKRDFLKSIMYIQIRPFLSKKLINELEQSSLVGEIHNQNLFLKLNSDFLDELQEIESDWGLNLGKIKGSKKTLYDLKKAGIRGTLSFSSFKKHVGESN